MLDIRSYKLVSEQVSYEEVEIIIFWLKKIIESNIPGNIVEFGCYNGTTSLFISRLLEELDKKREFHVYDSFEGLPEKTSPDKSVAGEQFQKGELMVSKKDFIKNYRHAGLPLPYIHKGWFDKLDPNDAPNNIAFAFLDGDFYESITDSLKIIENKLSPGAIIIVDDYQSESLPGAQKAVIKWLINNSHKIHHQKSLAIIQT